ncbi:FtsX-like permease family protein [Mesonia sp. HuA40]|uniref:ABC transporter permease n=1 Tax=Mesonia sp. HuA40 TaxID=2602761 RepID=UPI0011CCCF10|nr:FtsX-like permease family protein [Mesonia sp. HuA40]TXK72612.1 ABC transporter permease [Mesonia sp. HuA40]
MGFSLYIAKRYLGTKSKTNAINIITGIAALGVFAGAAALFIVLSGFAGLKAFSLSFTNEFDPDLKVIPYEGKTIRLHSSQINKLQNIKGISQYTQVVEEKVLLQFNNKHLPAFIKGIDENYLNVNAVDSSLIGGTWLHPKENQVVIGSGISRKLALGFAGYGDVLKLMVPKPGVGQLSSAQEAFESVSTLVIGIYSINEDLNHKYVFAPKALAQELLGYEPNEISGIELNLQPGTSEEGVKEQLYELFDYPVKIKNRIELNDKLYKMLNTENLAVYMIFTLVLIIALFNVGGAIVMSILDKRQNINTLYALGASSNKIKRIFLLQGSLLTFIGGILGLFLGYLIIVLQQQFHLIMITPTLPYPVEIEWQNLVLVLVTIMVLGVTASYIGATRIGKIING